ncbi:MAG: hypothetical protein WBE92_09645 [Steroidobacteraceae bacterium]
MRRALEWQNSRHDLPHAIHASILRTRLQLELETHEYAEAITSWEQLQKAGVDQSTAAALGPIMQQVEKLRSGPGEVAVPGEIQNGSWFLRPFKQRFRIEVSQGHIDDVKLRCDRTYVYFAFDPKLQYDVHGKYGRCSMQVEGSEGTRFKLVEF